MRTTQHLGGGKPCERRPRVCPSPAAARLMRPLLRCLARPMKEEWKMRPYLGVLPLVLSALPSEGVGVSVCG